MLPKTQISPKTGSQSKHSATTQFSGKPAGHCPRQRAGLDGTVGPCQKKQVSCSNCVAEREY